MTEETKPEECDFCGYLTKELELFDKKWLCYVCSSSVRGTAITDGDATAKQISFCTNIILSAIKYYGTQNDTC